MNKQHILALLLLLCCFSASYGQAGKNKYVLLDYDKAYFVDISVDTTLRLNQLPEYKNKIGARFTTPHKVHCDFKILYLWKDNYVMQMLLDNVTQVSSDSVNIDSIKHKFFDAWAFDETGDYVNEYHNKSLFNVHPDIFYQGQYLLEYNNNIFKIQPSYINILRCAPTISRWQINADYFEYPFMYSNFEPTNILNYPKDILKDPSLILRFRFMPNLPADKEIKNFICDHWFWTWGTVDMYIPESLSFNNIGNKKYQYKAGSEQYPEIENIFVKPIEVGNQKAYYQITYNKSYWDGVLQRSSSKYLYLPNVFFLKQFNSDFSFKIKIKINGQPLNGFIQSYTDDFKPKMHSTQRDKSERLAEIKDENDDQIPTNQLLSSPVPIKDSETDGIFEYTGVPPEGWNAFKDYINNSLRYPDSARKAKLQGNVSCEIIINKDGSIGNVKVINGIEPSLDAEAVRVLQAMPNWEPLRIWDPTQKVFWRFKSRVKVEVEFRLSDQ